VRRHGADGGLFADAVAPALLVAQAVGRIGNYFNKELFGGPTSLPWGLNIPFADRPAGYLGYQTFQPTFLYELIFDLALAAALVWLGHHRGIKAPGLFALYVTGYSAFRIFEESLRVDPSEHFLGLRLNMYVAIAGTVAGGVWFWYTQRYGKGVPATAGAAASGAGTGQGEQPSGPAATAGADDAPAAPREQASAEAGPDGEPPAEVGAEVGADHGAAAGDSGDHGTGPAGAAPAP
jgi:hypothetical protein